MHIFIYDYVVNRVTLVQSRDYILTRLVDILIAE